MTSYFRKNRNLDIGGQKWTDMVESLILECLMSMHNYEKLYDV